MQLTDLRPRRPGYSMPTREWQIIYHVRGVCMEEGYTSALDNLQDLIDAILAGPQLVHATFHWSCCATCYPAGFTQMQDLVRATHGVP